MVGRSLALRRRMSTARRSRLLPCGRTFARCEERAAKRKEENLRWVRHRHQLPHKWFLCDAVFPKNVFILKTACGIPRTHKNTLWANDGDFRSLGGGRADRENSRQGIFKGESSRVGGRCLICFGIPDKSNDHAHPAQAGKELRKASPGRVMRKGRNCGKHHPAG